ncbi:hypothetical protein CEXT_503201 [Caerostris extrusa]|uniref:Uncharacterized protein n=1 Tax=Caerostris extrusa TaxID=172846 RepID=A0AAV4P3J9_CAEEX|nr:hypothetical protein CEXT_503201 [Caerostris extrusa]
MCNHKPLPGVTAADPSWAGWVIRFTGWRLWLLPEPLAHPVKVRQGLVILYGPSVPIHELRRQCTLRWRVGLLLQDDNTASCSWADVSNESKWAESSLWGASGLHYRQNVKHSMPFSNRR